MHLWCRFSATVQHNSSSLLLSRDQTNTSWLKPPHLKIHPQTLTRWKCKLLAHVYLRDPYQHVKRMTKIKSISFLWNQSSHFCVTFDRNSFKKWKNVLFLTQQFLWCLCWCLLMYFHLPAVVMSEQMGVAFQIKETDTDHELLTADSTVWIC